ncbi:aromatic amino acid exporter [Vibrio aerogenes CECT 7868]|uniref:Aromatic amino acid exporter n=1 Tax=Vibrio aerogenes CECT 7868 TaxID=1216006 RepID=A0A1M5ZFS4_9VIBR|nr:DMT family transporter [Vibrio aerogenes]SHI22981.1 aromatic amino acid exporter [Vibrio aerogenes CECT 7868]
MNEKRALFFGLAAVILWSTVATAFKLTLAVFTPVQMLVIAGVTSSCVLLILCFIQGKATDIIPTFLAQPASFILSGLINPLGYYLILFKAYALLPASQAQAINYSWAITLTIMAAIFLRQPIRHKDYLAAAICYLGVLVIATQGNLLTLHFQSPAGVGLALLSTLLWSGYWILNTKNKADPIISILLGFLVALPLMITLACYEQADWTTQHLSGWLSAVYIGVFEMGITFFLWISALRLTQNTSRISNLIFISPFLSLIFLATIIHEPIHISTVVGLVIIITGLIIQQYQKKRKKH